jgi:hypothetical protein
VRVTRRVKHPARNRKFSVRDRLVEIISKAERMWGKPVIRPSDAEEVRQESALSGDESIEERDEDVSTPRDEAFIEDFAEEGTPRTPSSERLETPPLPECDCEIGHATPQESCTVPDQTEAHMGTPEMENTEEPATSQQAGVQDTPGAGLEVRSVNQSEASPHLGEHEGSWVNTETTTSEADMPPDASVRSRSRAEANTSELRPNDSEAAPKYGSCSFCGPQLFF